MCPQLELYRMCMYRDIYIYIYTSSDGRSAPQARVIFAYAIVSCPKVKLMYSLYCAVELVGALDDGPICFGKMGRRLYFYSRLVRIYIYK